MGDNGIYEYLNRLSKQKKVKLGDLAGLCGLSRTTLYRYTKGMIQIPPAVEASLSKALGMSHAERAELRRLIALTVQDSSLISSRYVMDRLIFNGCSKETKKADMDFVLYDKDSFFRTSQQINDMFLKHMSYDEFSCDIKVINCIEDEFQSNMLSMLHRLLSASDAVSVEHVLAFPKKDYLKCTETLLSIIPLLSFLNYRVLYDEAPASSHKAPVFNDLILAEMSYRESGENIRRFFVLSYLSGALSQCAFFDNEYLYRFFLENYNDYRSRCNNTLAETSNVPALVEYALNYEVIAEQCLIKSDLCYNKIPAKVYRSLLVRCSEAFRQQLNVNTWEDLDNLLSTFDARYSYAFKKGNIDVCSQSGLRAFAKEGMLSDHFKGMLPFDVNERKTILQALRNYMSDSSNGYNLYITEKNIAQSITAFKDIGLIIEFPADIKKGICDNIFIQNKMLVDVVFDYAKNQIPAYHAMPEKEALRFLDELIETLEQ